MLSLPREQLQGKPAEVNSAIQKFADSQGLPMLFGEAKSKLALQALAEMSPAPKMIVEFGAFVGGSAIAWGAALRDLNGANAADVRVYTFELDPDVAETTRAMLKLAGLDDIVTVVVGPASDSLKRLYAEGKIKESGVDMVFFDHWKEFYLPDLKLCEELSLFRNGSLAIADNIDFPGAPDYLAYVQKGGDGGNGSVRYETKSLEAGNAQDRVIEISKVVI
ncbi:S-adenosyl-L-methionine-dependent methyltransferase [Xylariaceae sp. FL0016]|nr:S-adenosyl-L-methionine-dependent methyltransferase [Xylariaceae sp. FL0016]